MDPACGDKDGLALLDDTLVAHIHLVSKEELALIGGGHPALIQSQVGWCRADHVEHFLTLYHNIGNSFIQYQWQAEA